jgi:hypothetical protein
VLIAGHFHLDQPKFLRGEHAKAVFNAFDRNGLFLPLDLSPNWKTNFSLKYGAGIGGRFFPEYLRHDKGGARTP